MPPRWSPLAVAICLLEVAVTGDDGPVALAGGIFALTAVPAGVGVAILRYRLYEIDRLINRTLVYAVLTAALAAVFAAISLGVGVAVGSGSTLATAAATLAVALLFGPLRARVQLLVDRRFDRARYAGLQTVQRFLEDLRAGRAAPEATGAMLAEALGDPALELRFRLDGDVEVDAAGRVHRGPRSPGPDAHARCAAAASRSRPSSTTRRSPSGPTCWTARSARPGWRSRSRACASRCAASSPRSRRRAPASSPPATRSAAGSSATSTTARSSGSSRSASRSATSSTSCRTRRPLDAVVVEVSGAIEELRELARGVRPAGLDDGLGHALRELAARSRLKTRVDVTDERFEDRVETAAYFVASEALANAAKHAARRDASPSPPRAATAASSCGCATTASAARRRRRAPAWRGSPTASPRWAAACRSRSPPGEGTEVVAELPCGS